MSWPRRQRPPRTLKRKAAHATVRELRATLQYIAKQLAREDLPEEDKSRLMELQLRFAARVARLGASVTGS